MTTIDVIVYIMAIICFIISLVHKKVVRLCHYLSVIILIISIGLLTYLAITGYYFSLYSFVTNQYMITLIIILCIASCLYDLLTTDAVFPIKMGWDLFAFLNIIAGFIFVFIIQLLKGISFKIDFTIFYLFRDNLPTMNVIVYIMIIIFIIITLVHKMAIRLCHYLTVIMIVISLGMLTYLSITYDYNLTSDYFPEQSLPTLLILNITICVDQLLTTYAVVPIKTGRKYLISFLNIVAGFSYVIIIQLLKMYVF